MFNSQRLQAALDQTDSRRLKHIGGGMPEYLLEEEESRRPLHIALAVAVVIHLLLFVIHFPESEPEPQRVGSKQPHYIVQQVRFEKPPPRQQQQKPKTREKKRVIPIPDTTPDEPEPLVVDEIEAPETDEFYDLNAVVGIPDGPPDDGRAGAMALTGSIAPPTKIFSPQPLYTEDARRAGVQGVVILEAVVDSDGTVRNVKVLKGLPMGLDKSAVDAVMTWRYEPAKLEGKPVPVYFTFTISFSLT
jgi:TonB family protein